MLKKLDRIFEWIANWIVVIAGVAVCVMIFAGAVARYVFHTDFYGSEELILLAAFWLYFIGSALASKHNTHIKAEMLDMFIKNKTALGVASVVKCLVSLLMAIVASVWAVQYVQWEMLMNARSDVFRFPMFIEILPIAISFIAWSIYCIRDLVRCIKEIRDERADEKAEAEA